MKFLLNQSNSLIFIHLFVITDVQWAKHIDIWLCQFYKWLFVCGIFHAFNGKLVRSSFYQRQHIYCFIVLMSWCSWRRHEVHIICICIYVCSILISPYATVWNIFKVEGNVLPNNSGNVTRGVDTQYEIYWVKDF